MIREQQYRPSPAKALEVLLAVMIFVLSAIWTAPHRSSQLMALEDEKHGLITIQVPVQVLPESVRSLSVRMLRSTGESIADSVLLNPIEKGAVELRFRLNPGSWQMALRALTSEGRARLVGLTSFILQANERLVGTIRFNFSASASVKPEIVVRWGTGRDRWKMSPHNPVIAASQNSWDQDHYYICYPFALRVSEVYYLWYGSGYNAFFSRKDSIWTAVAVSGDGISWSKKGAIVLTNQLPAWTNKGIVCRSVLFENERFQMWFTGISETNATCGIGTAFSGDGIHWRIAENPIIKATAERAFVHSPSVVRFKGRLYMFYSVEHYVRGFRRYQIHLSTSRDGVRWNDEGAVMKGRPDVYWEAQGVCIPSTQVVGNSIVLFYSTSFRGHSGELSMIGHAKSEDGINWTYVGNEAALTNEDTFPWQTEKVSHPSVIIEKSKVRMWFTAYSQTEQRWQIGYAESEMNNRE